MDQLMYAPFLPEPTTDRTVGMSTNSHHVYLDRDNNIRDNNNKTEKIKSSVSKSMTTPHSLNERTDERTNEGFGITMMVEEEDPAVEICISYLLLIQYYYYY